jgi:acyl carrier protein
VVGRQTALEFDLMWDVLAHQDGRFTLCVKYAADVYHPSTVARMGRDLVQILEQGLSAPDRPLPSMTRRAPLTDPARVEAALAELPGVDACRVMSRADGDGTATAAYVAISDESITPKAIRGHLASRLPEESIPSWFVLLDQLPLDGEGRVDLAVLNALPLGEAGPAVPRSPLEEPVRAVWERYLGRPVPDPEMPFFNVDGNSLVAVQIAAELQSQLGIPVPVRAIFEHPTIRALAVYLGAHRTSPDSKPADHPVTGDQRLGADLAAASEEELDALLALVEDSIG